MKYSRHDLEKLANHSVMLSMKTGDRLVDSVLGVLKSNPMNPEQIRRLTEMANTDMFLQKFKGTSGDDRFVDFEVADPEEIIKKNLGEDPRPAFSSSKSLTVTVRSGPEGTHVTKSVKRDPGLDSEDSRFYEDVTPTKLDKLDLGDILSASDLNGSSEEKVASASLSARDSLSPFDRNKAEELLLGKIADANYKCDNLAEKLASVFRGMYSKERHPSFEKEALANFGKPAIVALQAVRSKLGMPSLSANVSEEAIKTASDRYISNKKSEGMEEVGEYLAKLSQYAEAAASLEYLKTGTVKEAFMPGLGSLGLALGANSLTGDTTKGLSYQLSRKFIPLGDRIQAVDETAKDVRKKTVDGILNFIGDSIEDSMDERERESRLAGLKQKRGVATAQMIKSNPDLLASGKNNLLMAVNTIGKIAPELSTNVPFLTSHTRQMLYNSEGGIPTLDATSIQAMAKAEKALTSLNNPKLNPYGG